MVILNRLYSDYLIRSRLGLYEDFILLALNSGYAQMSLRSFYEKSRDGSLGDQKIIVHRHDIDTDVRTARKMFDIEKRCGITASYYFRISTFDVDFAREIENYGSESSYHFEEISYFAKRYHIKEAAVIRQRLPEIRDTFITNFFLFEKRLGKKISTVASHGDFTNRRLRCSNREILDDEQLRRKCGIECEVYDLDLLKEFDIYITDRQYPQYYRPICPSEAIGRYNRIFLTTHPRQVETNWVENTKDNLIRLTEELTW